MTTIRSYPADEPGYFWCNGQRYKYAPNPAARFKPEPPTVPFTNQDK